MIRKIRKADQELRRKFTDLYGDVRDFLKSEDLPDFVKADLETIYPDLHKQLSIGESCLKFDKCAILVAGLCVKS